MAWPGGRRLGRQTLQATALGTPCRRLRAWPSAGPARASAWGSTFTTATGRKQTSRGARILQMQPQTCTRNMELWSSLITFLIFTQVHEGMSAVQKPHNSHLPGLHKCLATRVQQPAPFICPISVLQQCTCLLPILSHCLMDNGSP
eukprot:SM000041S15543  [mRNA]  locus=s41:698730:699299:+ [translate_table: standard]